MQLDFEPLTNKNWDHFQELFGKRGACGGCWCMLWRLAPKQFRQQKGEGNRRAMKPVDDFPVWTVACLGAYSGHMVYTHRRNNL
jgi:hypothetical protein